MLQAPGMKWFTPTIARPLLTNDHERDVHVTKRKISGGPQQRDRRGIPRIGAHRRPTRHRVLGLPWRSAPAPHLRPAQTRPPSGQPTGLNGSISPTKGWKNSASDAHVESGRTRCLRDSQELGGAGSLDFRLRQQFDGAAQDRRDDKLRIARIDGKPAASWGYEWGYKRRSVYISQPHQSVEHTIWRMGWDSNPRTLAGWRFSRPLP
jgi:hypothetical protein